MNLPCVRSLNRFIDGLLTFGDKFTELQLLKIFKTQFRHDYIKK